jgi:hypothetical protein
MRIVLFGALVAAPQVAGSANRIEGHHIRAAQRGSLVASVPCGWRARDACGDVFVTISRYARAQVAPVQARRADLDPEVHRDLG